MGDPSTASLEIKAFLKAGAAKRLPLEQLPGSASDKSPDEGIWQYLKRVEFGNVCCTDLDHLYRMIICAKERLRRKRDIIRSCSRQCGYSVEFLSMRSVKAHELPLAGSEGTEGGVIMEQATYPVQFSVDYPDRPLNRLTTFFRIFTAIPIAIVLGAVAGGTWQWTSSGISSGMY